jgi:3-oxoacyl-[acyl-carrier protein] reductase
MENRKKVLVAGASSGIGAATAQRFAREGWDVCLSARREKEMLAIKKGLAPGDHLVVAGDASDVRVGQELAETINRQWGRLDAMVDSIGVWLTAHAIKSSMEEWRKPFDLMVNSAINLARAAVPLMKEGGRLIYVTSVHGRCGDREVSAYSMAKAAINQYCRALAVDLASQDILVNAIAPGFVETPMSIVDGASELETDWFREYYVEGHFLPLKRAGQPEEIAGVAYFLAGPDASYMTGQVLTVDGGLTLTL